MSRFVLRILGALTLLALLIVPLTASAHETVTAGKYAIEYGWLNEPPVVGQPNDLVINIGSAEEGESAIDSVDVSNLKVEISYGSETKTLSLQPLGEDTPGQFIAPLTPTRAGQYTLKLSGKLNSEALGEAEVSAEVNPEEVGSPDVVQFPKAAQEQGNSSGLTDWLGIGGLVAGLLGLILSIVALTRKK